jgi:exodeoxyribonuclease VII large subunit
MQNKARIYTVGQVNLLVKAALEERLPSRLTVRGEISDWKLHKGNCYFPLKDEDGVLPCVMWARNFRGVKFSPKVGMAVLATGHIDVYVKGGKYQLDVDKLEPEGVGALWLAFERIKEKLQAEGLFDEAHKKPLPAYPMRIGILTSESGAAIEDIKDSIWNRWPCARLFLYPVPVQGEGAAAKIAAALRDVNRRNSKLSLDVLIVGRGGGSPEDLWAFNEEVLARAIYDSRIPVISAVGHEIDTTVADLVADARASTPTKAGVVAVPDMQEVLSELANKENRLTHKTKGQLELAGQRLQTLLASSVFRNPLLPVHNREQELDDLQTALAGFVRELLAQAQRKLSESYEQVRKIEPHRLLGRKMVELNNWQNLANSGIKGIINNCRMKLTAAANRLAGLNPKSVLERGFSITSNKKTGLVVRSLGDVEVGDLLITELARENLIESKVTNKVKS